MDTTTAHMNLTQFLFTLAAIGVGAALYQLGLWAIQALWKAYKDQ